MADNGVGEIDAEGYAKMQAAMADAERIDIIIKGRNGFEVRMGYPIGKHEDATISSSIDVHRNELKSGWVNPEPFYEPIPTGRTIVWTIETKSVRVPESGT